MLYLGMFECELLCSTLEISLCISYAIQHSTFKYGCIQSVKLPKYDAIMINVTLPNTFGFGIQAICGK